MKMFIPKTEPFVQMVQRALLKVVMGDKLTAEDEAYLKASGVDDTAVAP